MRLLIILSFMLQFLPVDSQNTLHITGETNAFKDGAMVSISAIYPFNTFFVYSEIEDSTIIEGGKFNLLLKKVNSEFFRISITRENGTKLMKRIFLEPKTTKIVLKDSALKDIDIKGNKTADDYASFSIEIQKLKSPQISSWLWKEYDSTRKINPGIAQKIFVRIDSISEIMSQSEAIIAKKWMNIHPQSLLNSYILYYFVKSYISDDSLKKMFYELPIEGRKNSWGRELQYIISNLLTGVKAPNFAQNDTSGNKCSLSYFTGKGKYVLLDFWASWCGPCREKNPALRRIYGDFKSKNFTIVGISLDQSKKRWIGAIEKDSLPWPQLSDLKFWKNKAAQAYYIRTIPSNFLLGPDGKIIAKNISITDLHKKLTSLLK